MKRTKVDKLKDDNYKKNESKSCTNEEGDSVICLDCNTTFENFVKRVGHSCRQHRCSLCNENFQRDDELKSHNIFVHGDSSSSSINTNKAFGRFNKLSYKRPDSHLNKTKRSCEICEKPLRSRHQYCSSCLSTINNVGDYFLRDKSVNLLSSNSLFNKTTTIKDISRDHHIRTNGLSNNSAISNASMNFDSVVQKFDKSRGSIDSNSNIQNKTGSKQWKSHDLHARRTSSERKSYVIPTNIVESRKDVTQSIMKPKDSVIITRGQEFNNVACRSSRKRLLESDAVNSLPTSDQNSIDEQNRSRTSKKIKSNLKVTAEQESDKVQIGTLIRSLPDDCGILLKPPDKDGSNFKCPKCYKIFRSLNLGSVHYSKCSKNIEFTKNKNVLVSPSNVVWICSLCHLSVSHSSKLNKHKKICLTQTKRTSKSLESSMLGAEYKNACRKCPKCCYECISLIKYQDHPCKRILQSMKSCSVALDRLSGIDINTRGYEVFFECHQCKRVFLDDYLFSQHLQDSRFHPSKQLSESVIPLSLNINCRYYTGTVIKTELITLDDNDYTNSCISDVQTPNNVPLYCSNLAVNASQAGQPSSIPPLLSSPPTNINSSNSVFASTSRPTFADVRAENSYLENHFTDNQMPPSFLIQPPTNVYPRPCSTASISSQPGFTEARAENSFSETISSAPPSNPTDNELNFQFLNHRMCRCRGIATSPEEDIKPCMKCLTEMTLNQGTPNCQNNNFDFAGIKQELEDEEGDTLNIDEAPFRLNSNTSSVPVNSGPDLDLGSTFGYENSDVALQLIHDLQTNLTPPSSHKYLTPPATPDHLLIPSPSLPSANEPYCPVSPAARCNNELANNRVPSGLVSHSQSPNDLASISLDRPFTTSAEFIARLKSNISSMYEPAPTFETEQPVEKWLLPASLNVRHVHISQEKVIADAWAMIPTEDSEVVDRYICKHCFKPFQRNSLVNHIRLEVGNTASNDIVAVYVVDTKWKTVK